MEVRLGRSSRCPCPQTHSKDWQNQLDSRGERKGCSPQDCDPDSMLMPFGTMAMQRAGQLVLCVFCMEHFAFFFSPPLPVDTGTIGHVPFDNRLESDPT